MPRSWSPTQTGRRLDFDALLLRIHPAASRVRLLAEQTPARLVAFDLLALDEVDYMNKTVRAAARRPGQGARRRAGAGASDPGHHRPGGRH